MRRTKKFMNLIFEPEFSKPFRIVFYNCILICNVAFGQIIETNSIAADSTYVNYFEDGKTQRIQLFENGLLTGPSWEFHPSGQIMIHNNWKLGKKNGREIIFDQVGRKIRSVNWQNGILHGDELSFYPTGVIQKKIVWVNNLKHGKSIWYHNNSFPSAIYPYEKGLIHGDVIFYDSDGKENNRKRFFRNELLKKNK